MRKDDYGKWHRPASGSRWNTTRPGARRRQGPGEMLTRAGQGDYRGSYDAGAADHGQPSARYAVRRNGLPVQRARAYRAPGWQERAARAGLDLAAIAAEDKALR